MRLITVREGDQRIKITKLEAMIRVVMNSGLTGDRASLKSALDYIRLAIHSQAMSADEPWTSYSPPTLADFYGELQQQEADLKQAR